MFKNLKMRNKLLVAFFIITCISTFSTTLFSIYYFSKEIEKEAISVMRKHIKVSQLIYTNKIQDLNNIAETVSSDGTLEILTSLAVLRKIEEYLQRVRDDRGLHQLVILDADKQAIAQVTTQPFMSLLEKKDYSENLLVDKAFNIERAITSTELVQDDQQRFISITEIPFYTRYDRAAFKK